MADWLPGPEKLLEVWFAPSADALPASAGPLGLKAVSVEQWTEMLDMVHCKILSIIESEHVDAYLLSESSMFVFPHKLVLKTCGITTLLLGLSKILEIAALSGGFPHTPANPAMMKLATASTYRVFYSRKNFLYPDQQRGPHRSWRDEVRALDRLFQRGSAYMIGKMNGEHWYLYITEPDTNHTPPDTPEHEKIEMGATETKVLRLPETMASLKINGGVQEDVTQDETLEILMTDLEEENAKQFYLDNASAAAEGRFHQKYHAARKLSKSALESIQEESGTGSKDSDYDVFEQTSSDHGAAGMDDAVPEDLTTEGHALGTVVSDASGLSDVYPKDKYPDARIDAYLFTPCGFSANGVVPAAESVGAEGGATSTHYFTVHVTPEPQCSYASFETNVPASQTGRETVEVVEQVVNIFRPGRFSVTLFEAKDAMSGETSKKGSKMDAVRGYRRVERIVHDLDGYELVFRYFERHDWKGGEPRLGEAY